MDLNDQLLSVRQWVYQLFRTPITATIPPYTNPMMLETEGRVRNFRRPQWSIDRLNHRSVDYGAGGYRDDVLWQLTYYGLNRSDVDKTLSIMDNAIHKSPNRFDRIPGYRFNWQYPQPDAQPVTVTPGPGLPAGPYTVRVSGIDLCDTESAASVPVVVNLVAPNNALRIRILRSPALVPAFQAYNVYVNEHLEVAGLIQPGLRSTRNGAPVVVGGSNTTYAIAVLNSLLGTGVPPKEPANSNAIRWKFMRVNSYADAPKEDDEENGVFDGMVTMETSVMQERDQLQSDVVRTVGINLKVYAPQVVPVLQPVNILPTNPVIVQVSAG